MRVVEPIDVPRGPRVGFVAAHVVLPDFDPFRVFGLVSPTLEVPEEIVMWERFILRGSGGVGHLFMIFTTYRMRAAAVRSSTGVVVRC